MEVAYLVEELLDSSQLKDSETALILDQFGISASVKNQGINTVAVGKHRAAVEELLQIQLIRLILILHLNLPSEGVEISIRLRAVDLQLT